MNISDGRAASMFLSRKRVVMVDRFEQVVDRIEFESLDGVFRISRREDNHRAADERTYELHTAQVGHVDIHENQVDRIPG